MCSCCGLWYHRPGYDWFLSLVRTRRPAYMEIYYTYVRARVCIGLSGICCIHIELYVLFVKHHHSYLSESPSSSSRTSVEPVISNRPELPPKEGIHHSSTPVPPPKPVSTVQPCPASQPVKYYLTVFCRQLGYFFVLKFSFFWRNGDFLRIS